MKKLLLSAAALSVCFSVFAQSNHRATQSRLDAATRNIKMQVERPADLPVVPLRPINPTVSQTRNSMVEVSLGQTTYDLQSNYGSVGNRLKRWSDGTLSAVWTKGDAPTAYSDRGTGYNYYDGTAWAGAPTARIETYRTGWPNVSGTSSSGEYIVNHGTNPTNFVSRSTKGTGTWAEGALGTTTMTWPRMVVGGANGNSVHVIGNPNVAPFHNFYSRSLDGGATWANENVVLPNYTNYFFEGSIDGYDIDSRGDVVAIVMGGFSESLVLWKSLDNGATWTETVINEFPLAPWDFNTSISDVDGDGIADTIPTTDSGIAIVIDNNNTVHVVTGSTRILCEASPDVSYFPGTDGLLYWNETLPAGDITNNVIAFVDDIDGSGTIEIAPNIAIYQCGLTGMPTLGVDAGNNLHLAYSSIIENTTNGNPDPAWEESFRNVYYMNSSDGGANWSTPSRIEGSDFDEMVWPTLPKSIGNNVDLVYYKDGEPGNTFQPTGNPDPAAPYDVIYVNVVNPFSGINDVEGSSIVNLYPNPASSYISLDLNLVQNEIAVIELYNMLGEVVYSKKVEVSAGISNYQINVSDLSSGLYSLTATVGTSVYSEKVVIN